MATIKLYSYLQDHKRVYLGTPLIANRVKHGDIITNDQNEWVILIENGRTNRLEHHTPTRCTIERLNAAIMADASDEQAMLNDLEATQDGAANRWGY